MNDDAPQIITLPDPNGGSKDIEFLYEDFSVPEETDITE